MVAGIRSLWASVQDDPVFMRKVNGWLVWFWVANIPPVNAVYIFAPPIWKAISILYLANVSIYANIAGHWASWQASRVEVKQYQDEAKRRREEAEHPVEDRVVEAVVERTTVDPV